MAEADVDEIWMFVSDGSMGEDVVVLGGLESCVREVKEGRGEWKKLRR